MKILIFDQSVKNKFNRYILLAVLEQIPALKPSSYYYNNLIQYEWSHYDITAILEVEYLNKIKIIKAG